VSASAASYYAKLSDRELERRLRLTRLQQQRAYERRNDRALEALQEHENDIIRERLRRELGEDAVVNPRGRNPERSESKTLGAAMGMLVLLRRTFEDTKKWTPALDAAVRDAEAQLREVLGNVQRGVHTNPTLAILGNPEGRRGTLGRGSPHSTLSESRELETALEILDKVIREHSFQGEVRDSIIEAGKILNALRMQVARGYHRNPSRKKIARKVLAIDYVHASDGKKYTHDFTEDSDHGAVCAYVEDGGRRVVLEASDGKPIVGDY